MEHGFGLTFDQQWLRRFRRSLRTWYKTHARDLPWRGSADPYRVWISEIMLQQTTVTAVRPYFERFVTRFPDVRTLASASEQDVLRSWEGLGYYSRARNIHKAANRIAGQDGVFPDTVEELVRLPGIGRYTAGAIVSFAFDLPAPIVEANTLRLYSRLLGYRGDPRSSQGQRLLWEFAETILPRKSPGEFNQALMDLGATVCTPTAPACQRCPVKRCCAALAEDAQDVIPATQSRPAVTELSEAALAIHRRGKYLLLQRGATERWAGLWDFPRVELADSALTEVSKRQGGALSSQRLWASLEAAVAEQYGMDVEISQVLTTFRHTVTRYRITLFCFRGKFRRQRDESVLPASQWVSPRDFDRYPLSAPARKLARHLGK